MTSIIIIIVINIKIVMMMMAMIITTLISRVSSTLSKMVRSIRYGVKVDGKFSNKGNELLPKIPIYMVFTVFLDE